ncbi:MAG: AMP-binding protein, partial [Actinomycetes bacterium]
MSAGALNVAGFDAAGFDAAGFNAAQWLVDRHVAAGRGGAVAFHCGDEEVTYAGLQRSVWATGRGLQSLGVGPGDRVMMVVDDEPAFPATFLAGLRIGAIPIPVSTMLRPAELAVLAADSQARVVVLSDRYAACLAELMVGTAVTDAVLTGPGSASGSGVVSAGAIAVHRWSAFDDATEPAAAATDRSTPGFWLYTSGTTGKPKGAIHRHGDLEAICTTYARTVLDIRATDVCYSVPKLFFAFGLGNSLVFPLSVGAGAVLDPDPPAPTRAAALLARHRPTLFFAPPGFCAAMADVGLPPDALSSARATVTAGEVLPAEVQR